MLAWIGAASTAALNAVQARLGRIARAGAFWVAGALMVLVMLGWLAAAAYTALKFELGPVFAQLILAGIFLLMAAIFFIAASVSGRPPAPRIPESAAPETAWTDPGRGRPAGFPAIAAAFAYGLARGFLRRRD